MDKFKQMEKEVMTDTTGSAGQETVKSQPMSEMKSETVQPAVTQSIAQEVAGLLGPQLASLVKLGIDDAVKGNFSGAWGDVKGQLINDGIQDAISATRELETQVMSHVASLGSSKQLDIAKGKMADAFIWIEKHLGIGG